MIDDASFATSCLSVPGRFPARKVGHFTQVDYTALILMRLGSVVKLRKFARLAVRQTKSCFFLEME